jgi:hypothetical protein
LPDCYLAPCMVWHTAIAGSERAYRKKRYPQPAALHNLSMAECLPTVCRLLAAPPPTCSGDPSTEHVTANCDGMDCMATCKDGYAGTASIVCEVSGGSAQWTVTDNCHATCKGLSWHTQRNSLAVQPAWKQHYQRFHAFLIYLLPV